MGELKYLWEEEIITEWKNWSWSSFWNTLWKMLLISIICGCVFGLNAREIQIGFFMWVFMLIVVVLPFSAMAGAILTEPAKYETIYTVMFEEGETVVSSEEFNKNYKVIDQDGHIYTVREKESDDNRCSYKGAKKT